MQKLIIQKSQKENDSDSYFDDTSEQEDYLFQSKNSNDYFNSSSDSDIEYKTKKPEITYITETNHYGRVKIYFLINYKKKKIFFFLKFQIINFSLMKF